LTISVIESDAGRAKHQSGVAFWVSGRLVGRPGWTVMGEPVIDGRRRPGRGITFIVRSDDLMDEILSDWTGFRHTPLMEAVAQTIVSAAREELRRVYADRVRETTADVLDELGPAMQTLGRGDRIEVAEVVQAIATTDPLVDSGALSAAVASVIEVKKN